MSCLLWNFRYIICANRLCFICWLSLKAFWFHSLVVWAVLFPVLSSQIVSFLSPGRVFTAWISCPLTWASRRHPAAPGGPTKVERSTDRQTRKSRRPGSSRPWSGVRCVSPRQRGDSVFTRPVWLPDLGHQLQVSGQPQVQRVLSQSCHGGQQPRRHSVIAQNKPPGLDNPPPPNERHAVVHVLHVESVSREFRSSFCSLF